MHKKLRPKDDIEYICREKKKEVEVSPAFKIDGCRNTMNQ